MSFLTCETLRVHRNPIFAAAEFWVVDQNANGDTFVGRPVVTEKVTQGSEMTPTFRLSDEAAEHLLTELWNAGYRPRGGEGSVAHVAAMREHIADLRRIVFEDPER